MMNQWRGLFLLLAFALLPFGSNSWGDIYYVSGSVDETLIIKPESSVWRLDEKTGEARKIYSSGKPSRFAKGFHKFEFWPEEDVLVGWATINDDSGKGELLWLPLFEPQKVKHIKLLNSPIFSGYLWKKEKKIIIDGGLKPSIVYDVNNQDTRTIEDICDVPRDELYQDGFSFQMEDFSPVLVEMHRTGKVDYRIGVDRCSSGYRLGKSEIDSLANINQGTAGRIFNNNKAFVLGAAEDFEGKNHSCFFIYKKEKSEWVKLCSETFSLAKMREDWIFLQHVTLDRTRINQGKDGDFQFYNIENNQSFNAKLGHDSEVLDLDDDWLLYRAGDTLYKTRIQTDHLSEPVKLISADNIKNVHWALWAEGEGPVNQEKHQTFQSRSENMIPWFFVFLVVPLVGAGIYFIRRRGKGGKPNDD